MNLNDKQEKLPITALTQKAGFSTPQINLRFIKPWFSASIPIAIGMVKIANIV